MEKEIIFTIKVRDLQNETIQKIGRELTEDEIISASKGVRILLTRNYFIE